jgi:hypothetical protein
MPGTNWTPVGNFSPGGVTRPPQGMVVHTAVSPNTTQALDGVVRYENEPSSQVSSYFVVGIDGTIDQCVDLDDKAWTQAAGNRAWVGVENIGDGTKEPLTDAQLDANARIFAWLHETYGVPLQRTEDPLNGHGLGWHGMGGAAWGGHNICPGAYVHAQLDEIVARARGTQPQPKGPPNMFLTAKTTGAAFLVLDAGPTQLANNAEYVSLRDDAHVPVAKLGDATIDAMVKSAQH